MFYLSSTNMETMEPTILQSDKDVLDKGLEIAIFKYNEELKKYDSYNSRALYPISLISILLTITSYFIKDIKLIDINPFLLGASGAICVLFVSICLLYILITKPYKIDRQTCPEPKYFYGKLDDVKSKNEFSKYLITIYTEDHQSYFEKNKHRGKYLFYMNVLLSIIIILYLIIIYSLYFHDYILDCFQK